MIEDLKAAAAWLLGLGIALFFFWAYWHLLHKFLPYPLYAIIGVTGLVLFGIWYVYRHGGGGGSKDQET